MKAIIDGLRYDTETAEMIDEASARGYACNDFSYWSEKLYRTKKGNYFLAGEGGALSRYSEAFGQNGSTGGKGRRGVVAAHIEDVRRPKKIIPIDTDEAREWCERHSTAETVESLFPGAVTDA